MQKVKCPICRSDVIIDDEAVAGDLVSCSNCENELEIINLSPAQLSPLDDDRKKEAEQEEE